MTNVSSADLRNQFVTQLRAIAEEFKNKEVNIDSADFAVNKLAFEVYDLIFKALDQGAIERAQVLTIEGFETILENRYGKTVLCAVRNGEEDELDEEVDWKTCYTIRRVDKASRQFSKVLSAMSMVGTVGKTVCGFYRYVFSSKENVDKLATFASKKIGTIINETANFIEKADAAEDPTNEEILADLADLCKQGRKEKEGKPDLSMVDDEEEIAPKTRKAAAKKKL